jgi:NAD(P)-dependent dehydrogenase (short-subunit alcohol dehydrogenase family)
MEELAGKGAVVTGAGGGIGRGIALALAAAGMRLVLADTDADGLRATGAELRGSGAEAIEATTDVRDASAVESLAAVTLDTYGAVHVLCNNAGVWTVGRQWETDLADWRWVIDVNLWGAVHGVRTFVPLLLRNPDGGHVVNVSSMGGLLGGPLTGPYSASKHAIVGLSKGLRAELAHMGSDVGVSVVCPGKVRSAILDNVNKRPGRPGEPVLTPEAQAVTDAMRGAGSRAISAEDAGRLVREAIKRNSFWVLPGAGAHLPLLEQETAELLEAFIPASDAPR